MSLEEKFQEFLSRKKVDKSKEVVDISWKIKKESVKDLMGQTIAD